MGQSAGDNHCEPVTRTKLKMNKSIIALLLIAQVFSSPLPQDPNDDAEVFGGPVRTNTDYDSDSFPDTFGGLFPRVRVLVVPVGTSDYEDLEPALPSRRPSFGNVFNILRSVLGRGSPASSGLSSKTALMMFRTTLTRSGTDRMRLTLIPRKMVLTSTTLLILLRCWRMVRLFTLTKLLLLTLTRMETLSSSTKLSSTTSVPMTT